MKLIMTRLIFISSISFFCSIWAQSSDTLNEKFIQHLDSNKLYFEKLTYLSSFDKSWDRNPNIVTEKIYTHFKLKNYRNSLELILRHKDDSLINHITFPIYLRCLFEFDQKATISDTALYPTYSSLILMNHAARFSKVDFENYSYAIKESYRKYEMISRKKNGLAVVLSSLIPGAGKWYIGKGYDGLTSFLTVGLLGLQCGEAYYKKGFLDWRTILFGGLTVSFYSANVYGTYKAIKKEKRDRKLEFIKTLDENFYSNFKLSHF